LAWKRESRQDARAAKRENGCARRFTVPVAVAVNVNVDDNVNVGRGVLR
jgi:hypothetical protein